MGNDLFKSMGLDEVEADVNHIADGVYPAFVFESTVVTAKTGKNAGKDSWVLTYKIAEGQYKGRTQQEWFSLDPANTTVKPWLKRRIISLGVPETKVGEFEPADVVGTAVTVKIQTKEGYQNVRDVKLQESGSAPAPLTPQAASSLM